MTALAADDLALFDELVADARIVGLGESVHHAHEFYVLRDQLLRRLVERHGFRAFVMESGWCEGAALTEWTRGGDGDLTSLLRSGFTYGMGACREMADQLAWMRANGVDYHGMDMIGGLATPLPGLEPVFAVLPADAATYYRGRVMPIVDKFATEQQDVNRYYAVPEAERDALTAAIADLIAYVDDRAIEFRTSLGQPRWDVVRRHLELVRQFDDLLRGFPEVPGGPPVRPFADGRTRDRYMADNVDWILDQLAHARIVVAAHNGHLKREPGRGRAAGSTDSIAMGPGLGAFLADRYGPGYVPIAFTHTDSVDMPDQVVEAVQAGSIEARLSGVALMDLRSQPGNIAQSIGRSPVYLLDLPASFDAVVHVPTIRPFEAL